MQILPFQVLWFSQDCKPGVVSVVNQGPSKHLFDKQKQTAPGSTQARYQGNSNQGEDETPNVVRPNFEKTSETI